MSRSNKPKTKIIWSGFFLRIFILGILGLMFYIGLFVINFNKNLNKTIVPETDSEKNNVSIQNIKEFIPSLPKLKGEENDRINILLLGLDGGSRRSGTYLTDTIALASINPKTYQSAILSIPRDLYVQIPGTNYHTKINALYTYGLKNKNLPQDESVKLIRTAVENITGQKIPYYVIIDFAGFKKVIETLGGIDLEVPENIKDTHYPGPNYSYETFEIKKGWQHLDADTALKYARVRHVKGGDFGRARRQQQIISATREKTLSLKILGNPKRISGLLNILGEHIKTNINKKEMLAFANLLKNINIHQTTTMVLDAWNKNSLLKSTHIKLGGIYAYVLIPKIKSYADIQTLSKNIFNLNKLKEEQENIEKEKATIFLYAFKNKISPDLINLFHKWGHVKVKQIYKPIDHYCHQNKDTIVSFSEQKKLFTLNDLVNKFNIEVTYKTPPSSVKNKAYPDILICLTKPTISFFTTKTDETIKNNYNDNNLERAIISTDGQAIYNEK